MNTPKLASTLSALLLALALVACPFYTSASAVQFKEPVVISQSGETNFIELSLDPRYTNISRIASGLTISSLGRAACTGTATVRYKYKRN